MSGHIITTTDTEGRTLYAKFGECGVEWVENASDACHFLRRSDAEQMSFGEDCESIFLHSPAIAPGYAPDLAKDIGFLKEMEEVFDKIQNGNGWDRMQMDHLGIMIGDWLRELEKVECR
jgi:hypothetical protein